MKSLFAGHRQRTKQRQRQIEAINLREQETNLLTDDELLEQAEQLRQAVRSGEQTLDDVRVAWFALVREAAVRVLGLRLYDVQLHGGLSLADGNIAEMKTGEGKTLTAVAPVSLWSLAGDGVHVVTVNDYLAQRDAEWMQPVYAALGCSVAWITAASTITERQQAYNGDIVYGTNSEFGFDYLRDNLQRTPDNIVQRPEPAFALVDEVDSILIDEARTPLIISGAPETSGEIYQQFARIAKTLVGRSSAGLEAEKSAAAGKLPISKVIAQKQGKQLVDDSKWDYEYDEQFYTIAPTARGIANVEKALNIGNLYISERGPLVNHLIQACKAQSLYHKDKQYAVVDGEVLIIDEFTGRIMEGRRWSDGLHQAVEAKEGVAVQEENVTEASITLQNYFRRYQTLAGMTGTAMTEFEEFHRIYGLEVEEIPSHRPVARVDHSDYIYRTKNGKWQAILAEVQARHERQQPVLVGTTTVADSEQLSQRLRQAKVPHQVLNAKPEYAAREADIIAEAGRLGAVTIATNMAGRGVDIQLGGNVEYLLADAAVAANKTEDSVWLEAETIKLQEQVAAERQQVLDVGGLYVLGCERHESRRIDNQLRGRSGRQGDPGETRFYLSAEDDLLRVFAGDRIGTIMGTLERVAPERENQPIENRLLTKAVAKSQQRLEEQHYLSRKRLLEYDDVLNIQREGFYAKRHQLVFGENIDKEIERRLQDIASGLVNEYCSSFEEWDGEGLLQAAEQYCPMDAAALAAVGESPIDLEEAITAQLQAHLQAQREDWGDELSAFVERSVLRDLFDEHWQYQLADMDHLKEAVQLRSHAQIQPLQAYQHEGFELFQAMFQTIWEQWAMHIFHIQGDVETAKRIFAQRAEASRPAADPAARLEQEKEKPVGNRAQRRASQRRKK